MLDSKKLSLVLLLAFIHFSCASYASQEKKHEIDDLINQANLAAIKRDYVSANNILLDLLTNKESLSFGQEVNIYHRLLELTFISKDYNKSKEYGHKLYSLIEHNDKYRSLKKRLIFRLCESEDWAAARYTFNDICSSNSKAQEQSKTGHP